jgi:hypothetical protein
MDVVSKPLAKTQAELGYPRLLQFYDMVLGIPAERINLGSWRRNDLSDKRLLTEQDSVACPGGWATAFPPFKAEGLRFDTDLKTPTFNNETGYSAMAAFLGIHVRTSINLFRGAVFLDEMKLIKSGKDLFLGRLRRLMIGLRVRTNPVEASHE